ncbi:cupin domain-containing protein [Hymenobacter terricola]|uniref:cupin domain-containing protein n=1 Tax=Hymenobacter terricola TaxID=2819236 RepID=UPI001B306CAA|nr:cupin domain-containing protein [Hymenobacter terricola]
MTRRELTLMGATALAMCIPLALVARVHGLAGTLPSSAFEWNSLTATPTKVGEKRQVCDSPTETLDNLEIHVTTLNPGEFAHPPHQHPDEELTIVREGTVEALVNGEMKRLGPGSVIFQAPNRLHSLRNVGTTRVVYHVVKWRTAKTGAAGAVPAKP